ncbi:MAG TPA: hypothetical protein VFO64_04980 [Gaiellaceae bacterium]|jgi:hypothetical protein|nr:hypothetical protein [Gaiellaceae bacterium]
MASKAEERAEAEQHGVFRRNAKRTANRVKTAVDDPSTDAQGLVELACECTRLDCERTVRVPLYVYRRMLDADQYLLHAGHHAFARYRTIISVGLMRIEEAA